MATPDALPPLPIVYKSRGVVVDTQLVVFDTTFHLSSTVLKMNSQFFDRYLDSADKTPQSNAGRIYKYEWVTKVLENGEDWQLVCEGPNASDLNISASKIDTKAQTKAFKNILDTMYHHPYVLEHAKEIITMTNLARFYMALPTVSRSLDKALKDSWDSLDQLWIKDNACDMLTAAYALRHKQLYKNALIWCLGPFRQPVYTKLEDRALLQAARCQAFKLRATILDELYQIFGCMLEEYDDGLTDDDPENKPIRMVINFIKLSARHIENQEDSTLHIPALFDFFKDLRDQKDETWSESIAKIVFTTLTKSNLSFGYCFTGQDPCRDYFLFSTVDSDWDLPWDAEELDW
ncbi:hypothetical protein VTL71DRAFT_5458 [Oculimacula yallundae]|uniref:BTB domain-containing protein n=1 Tax=Oculimacula yallundae TaxID=86028 RepID=A0ABR4C3N3_9HELO